MTFSFELLPIDVAVMYDEALSRIDERAAETKDKIGGLNVASKRPVRVRGAVAVIVCAVLGMIGLVWAQRQEFQLLWGDITRGRGIQTVELLTFSGPFLIIGLGALGVSYKLWSLTKRARLGQLQRNIARPEMGTWLGQQTLTLTSGSVNHVAGLRSQTLLWVDIASVDVLSAGVVLMDVSNVAHYLPRQVIGDDDRVAAVARFAQGCLDAAGGGAAGRIVRHLAAHHAACATCGHDLYRIATAICPECGADLLNRPLRHLNVARE